ncbi:MAG: hypothetical protein WCK53_16550, partial [Methanomicrobiales archaeon]
TPVATVGSSVVKGGVKIPKPSTTFTGISPGYVPGQFTTTIPGPVVNRPAIATAPSTVSGSYGGTSRDFVQRYNPVNATVIRNFNAMTGLMWVGLRQME